MFKIIFYLCDRILVRSLGVERDTSVQNNSMPNSRTISLCIILRVKKKLQTFTTELSYEQYVEINNWCLKMSSVNFTVTMPYKTANSFAAGHVAEDVKMVYYRGR